MNKEITNFLQNKRRVFKETQADVALYLTSVRSKKDKEKVKSITVLNNKLKEQ